MGKKNKKSHLFDYEAIDREGKGVSGSISAASGKEAKLTLMQQGCLRIKCRQQKVSLMRRLKQDKVGPTEVASFARQMATMMTAGIPLVQSFDIVANGTDNHKMKEVTLGLKKYIEEGATFGEALKHYPLYFDDIPTISANLPV